MISLDFSGNKYIPSSPLRNTLIVFSTQLHLCCTKSAVYFNHDTIMIIVLQYDSNDAFEALIMITMSRLDSLHLIWKLQLDLSLPILCCISGKLQMMPLQMPLSRPDISWSYVYCLVVLLQIRSLEKTLQFNLTQHYKEISGVHF